MYLQANTLLQGGKYRIVRFISSGGFGCTYEAEHVMLGERVAIKEFFVKDFCNRDEATAYVTIGTRSKRGLVDKLKRKFIEEAKILYRMQHPGIVRVFDIFEGNGTAYFVMDYIDGPSLSEIVAKKGALSEVRAIRYIRQVAEALKYVHDQDRLHLDIKPSNIMVDSNDNAILIDFGTSKQYDEVDGENTSTLLGKTPGYAPLEQMGNDVVTFMSATDIYALGATLYKLLTGITPLSATLLASGEELEPLPDTVSEATRSAVAASMSINKNKRPQTVEEFLALLDGVSMETQNSGGVPQQSQAVRNEKPIIANGEETLIVGDSGKDVPGDKREEEKERLLKPIIWFVLFIVTIAGFYIIWSSNKYAEEQMRLAAIEQHRLDSIAQVREAERLALLEQQRKDSIAKVRSEEAAEAKRKAEDPQRNYELGQEYFFELNGKDQNYVKAAKYYRIAAEQGHADAQSNLGACYENGTGVSKDYTEAVKWYRKAATQGQMYAQNNLGRCYEYGIGVAKDCAEAAKWYSKAAEQGHVAAKNNLQRISKSSQDSDEEIYLVVESQPEFPGGMAELLKYLQKNIKYPTICQEQGIQGRVVVQFVVNVDGSITDPHVVKPVNPYLDKEALRVVQSMPKWKPGEQRGKKVRVRYPLPITFRLSN